MEGIGYDGGNSRTHIGVVRNMEQNRRGGIEQELLAADQPYGMETAFYYSNSGEILTGKEAVKRAMREGKKPITCVKKLLMEKTVHCNGRDFSGVDIIKAVAADNLANSVKLYDENIGVSDMTGKPFCITLAYPATFSVEERDLYVQTISSIRLPGDRQVKVTGTIAEPAAAALSYLAEKSSQSNEEMVVHVFDLGGGTFDAAICKVYPNGQKDGDVMRYYDIILTDGDADIGGEKFTQIVDRMLTDKLEKNGETLTPRTRNSIYAAAETCKINLSGSESDEPLITGVFSDVSITRKEFADDPESKNMISGMMKKMQEMQEQYGDRIDMILMTGGASQMPMIHDALKQHFQNTDIRTYKPATAVSYGAARYGVIEGGSNEGIERVINKKKTSDSGSQKKKTTGAIRQRTPHALGICCFDKGSPTESVFVMIPAGTTIPFTSEYFEFSPHKKDQERMTFKAYESKHIQADVKKPNQDFIQVVNVALNFDHKIEQDTICCARLSIDDKGMLYVEVYEKDQTAHKTKGSKILNSLL